MREDVIEKMAFNEAMEDGKAGPRLRVSQMGENGTAHTHPPSLPLMSLHYEPHLTS